MKDSIKNTFIISDIEIFLVKYHTIIHLFPENIKIKNLDDILNDKNNYNSLGEVIIDMINSCFYYFKLAEPIAYEEIYRGTLFKYKAEN